jgi:hypothetical protein
MPLWNVVPQRRKTPIEELRDEYNVSDLELTDTFNDYYRTHLPSPIKPTKAEAAREALMVQA